MEGCASRAVRADSHWWPLGWGGWGPRASITPTGQQPQTTLHQPPPPVRQGQRDTTLSRLGRFSLFLTTTVFRLFILTNHLLVWPRISVLRYLLSHLQHLPPLSTKAMPTPSLTDHDTSNSRSQSHDHTRAQSLWFPANSALVRVYTMIMTRKSL